MVTFLSGRTTNPYIEYTFQNSSGRVEVTHRKGRVWNKRERCLFCNKDVTNFSRHLFRKHSNEDSVVKILAIPRGNSQRKLFIDILRKQGNFSVLSENIVRPVQRPPSSDSEKSLTYLPCKFCKGLYKKATLRRHAVKCHLNKHSGKNKVRYASEGQTLLAFTESRKAFLNKLRLKSEVFDKMHADRISLMGKSDPLICQYAEDYLKKHKRPHIKNLVSNKIRELGRLLIPLSDMYNIHSMLEALKPENFDKVISAARIISGYSDAEKTFKAPSLALHMRTILLAVCDSATILLLKKDSVLAVADYVETLKTIENFRKMVESNWKFEMGSLALKDLTEKNSMLPRNIPITADIIIFNKYCYAMAEKASEKLSNDLKDTQAFKSLSEALLAITISINRKRVGDVQYIKLESYNITNQQEDSLGILSEMDKELTKNFKRIVAIGKGSKPVAILFPKKIETYMGVMLKSRQVGGHVPKENPFLFGLQGSSTQWINGSSTLRKYACACGAKNPNTLTSSRLRKQIATVLQILSLSEVDMEQVATFMGHTKKTHEEFYRYICTIPSFLEKK